MEERIDLVVVAEEKRQPAGLSLSVVVSFIVHGLLIFWFVSSYKPAPPVAQNVPMARYVELVKQNPKQFTEAPGPKVDRAPLTAPLSDANRKASAPQSTGMTPTKRPGDGGGLYTPPMGSPPKRGVEQASSLPSPSAPPTTQHAPEGRTAPDDTFAYRESTAQASAGNSVDWRNAIREVGKVASLGGGDGLDIGKIGGTGGEKGFVEQGPLSFETQWYDWGPYAQSMVSRIRVNWYANMPQLIRTGLKGVVTIRFTIHRDGRISDVTILESSGVPPYDYAAKKAIESSSPLNPLPKDFPNPSERVTAMFYYNMEIPSR